MKQLLYLTKQMHHYAGHILYINLFGMMIISLLEGAGILMLIPMLSLTGIEQVNFAGTPLAGFYQYFQQHSLAMNLTIILIVFVAIVVGQALLQRNLTLRDVRIHTGFINYIRMQTYDALLQANWDFYTRKRKSDLVNSLTSELGRVTGGVQTFIQLLASVVFTIIQVAIAFWLSPLMTTFVIACGVFLALFSRRLLIRSKRVGKMSISNAQQYLGGISDHFQGMKDIKSNMLERSRMAWLRDWCHKVTEERMEYVRITTQSQLYYKLASALFIALFIIVAINLFYAQLEQLLLIVVIFTRLWPRFAGIQANMEQIAATIPSLQEMMALQEECHTSMEIANYKSADQYVAPLKLTKGLSCENITFRYNRHIAHYALQNVNFHVPVNSMTAIVGRSGAGKSTLIDIIMGLLKPEQGRILLDGEPLSEHNLLRYRRSISYVPQDPFLFNGTIRDNLLMVSPDATENDLLQALQFSSAAEFVLRLPNGLDTHIGDRGVKLSGGERQRLVLARAILKRPSILILDEATSALDTENERKIQQAIEAIKGSLTIIVIAHRLSTISHADQVIVLDEGQLIQKGAFGQLAKEKRGMFRRLLINQEVGG